MFRYLLNCGWCGEVNNDYIKKCITDDCAMKPNNLDKQKLSCYITSMKTNGDNMKTLDIHIITQINDGGNLAVISGGTNKEKILQEYDSLDLIDGQNTLNVVTIRVPEIILTGYESLVDLTLEG